jgi:hypothetical protein
MPTKRQTTPLKYKNGNGKSHTTPSPVVNVKQDRVAGTLTNGNGATPPPGHESHLNEEELLRVLTEVKNGNFTVRMPIDQLGLSGKICDTLNDIISLNEKMMLEFTRAGNTIGKQGKLTQRIEIPVAKGSWSTGVESLNALISDLVHPTIEIAHVISSVAKGNLQ